MSNILLNAILMQKSLMLDKLYLTNEQLNTMIKEMIIIKQISIEISKGGLKLIKQRKNNFNLFQYKFKIPMHIKKIIFNYFIIIYKKDLKYFKDRIEEVENFKIPEWEK